MGSERRSAAGCWVERLTAPTERIGLREWDVGRGPGSERELEWLVLRLASGSASELGLVAWPGRVVEPDPHRSEDRPLHAERIRRSWQAGKCAAMGPVVGLGYVAGQAGAQAGMIQAVRVWGRAGSGSRSCL